MNEYGAWLERYWQGKNRNPWRKTYPIAVCQTQTPHGLAWEFSTGLRGARPEKKAAVFTSKYSAASAFFLTREFVLQVRRQQVDQGRQQVAPRSDQCRDRELEGPAASPAVDTTAPVAAAADGPRLRLRAEGELLPAGWVRDTAQWNIVLTERFST